MGKKNSEQNAMSTGESLFGGVDQERLEKAVEVKEKEEKESVNVRISKKTRQLLKSYCVDNGLLMGDYVAKLIENDLKAHGRM